MNENTEHPTFEVLGDLLDGNLDPTDSAVVSEHISGCASCAATYQTLTGLVSAAKGLPRSVLPPDDLWAELRQSLNKRKEIVLPSTGKIGNSGNGSTNSQRLPRRMIAVLAAAAVILIALSSGITALVLRRGVGEVAVRDSLPTTLQAAGPRSAATFLAGFSQAENEFNRTIGELKQAVDTQRGQLSPETIRTVDRSLAVVDSAIAEARTALLADPNNQMLIDLLSASYQRKVDLLRRTSELGSRT